MQDEEALEEAPFRSVERPLEPEGLLGLILEQMHVLTRSSRQRTDRVVRL